MHTDFNLSLIFNFLFVGNMSLIKSLKSTKNSSYLFDTEHCNSDEVYFIFFS